MNIGGWGKVYHFGFPNREIGFVLFVRACVRAKLCAGAEGDGFPRVKPKKLNFVVCLARPGPAARPPGPPKLIFVFRCS